eukprot:13820836-Alexandrium_andersonii.AAC.1
MLACGVSCSAGWRPMRSHMRVRGRARPRGKATAGKRGQSTGCGGVWVGGSRVARSTGGGGGGSLLLS